MAWCTDHSRSVIGGSDEVKVIFCEPCEQDSRQTEAEGFCMDCSEYLCRQCYKNHKLFKAFRNHVLQDKHTMPQTVKDTGLKDLCITKCDLHGDKIIEYFCQSCDKLGCTTCITLNHRQCDNVEHIPKIVNAININRDLQDYITNIDEISQEVQTKKSTLNLMSTIADDMRLVAKAELSKQRKEINKFFDELEKEMENKIDEIHTSNTISFKETSTTYNTMDKHLKELKTDIGVKHKAGQQCEAFIAMKQSARGTMVIEKQLQTLQKKDDILQYEVFPSSQITEMMKRVSEICRIETGSNKIHTKIQSETIISQLKPSDTSITTTPGSFTSVTLKLNTQIDVTTATDKDTPYIRGLTMINDNLILVTDNKNKSVKVFDMKNAKMTSEIKIYENVWNATSLKNSKIALATKSKIQFLLATNSGKLRKDKSSKDIWCACFDLTYNNFTDTFITAQGSSIKILDMQGSVLKSFDHDIDNKRLFTSCYGLAINKDHNTIYATDTGKHRIVSLTLDGNIKTVYTDEDLINPWGITVDSNDNVYVCSVGAKKILQLSADCQKLQHFTDINCGSICYTKGTLFVGGHKYLCVYDLV